MGEWLDRELRHARRHKTNNISELMVTGNFGHTARLAYQLGSIANLGKFRDELLARGLLDDIAIYGSLLDVSDKMRREREHCGQPDESAACKVKLDSVSSVARFSEGTSRTNRVGFRTSFR